ncbi:hypothetical protein GMA1_66 [Gordonia phage GMA1]|uniref:hypothetical protein n=1 Tax=Gordonia phage GMA1 TaxID=1647470 RepID=UPI0007B62D2B|nr:hypothetical protein BH788_gp66 [Gordonia phage GMA1]AKJ72163.1 hypothetical protein GMA1_66 [Gordonia phage GMA1]
MSEHPEPTPLSQTVDRFTRAVHDLCGRTVGWIERDNAANHPAFGDSRLTLLIDACTAGTGTGHGGHARSLPPVHVDAVDLMQRIERRVEHWCVILGECPIARRPDRPRVAAQLDALADRSWAPGMETALDLMIDSLERWRSEIDRLLDPPRRWDLIAPCPACGVQTVHRTDSAGETVRQPALSIADGECVCLHCQTVWGVQHFEHLKRVIDTASGE